MNILNNNYQTTSEIIHKIDKKVFETYPYENILKQLECLFNGSYFLELQRPATVGDGIIRIDESQENLLYEVFEKAKSVGRVSKFIPASGAATRMFSEIHSAINELEGSDFQTILKLSKKSRTAHFAKTILENIKLFAFWDDLCLVAGLTENQFDYLLSNKPTEILKFIINSDGLNYDNKPKALIKFHKYENHSRTAFIEHLYESTFYQDDTSKIISIHFTISENHFDLFKEEEKNIQNFDLLKEYVFNLSYSFQKKSTDSITLTINNELFLDSVGQPIFRPAGHGALLENLNDLKADIIFIKNVDNVCVDRLKPTTVKYKKLLAGFLLLIQRQVFEYLSILEKKSDDEQLRNQILNFSDKIINIKKPNGYFNWDTEKQRKFLFDKLNRPIRVCGVVKNEGEPGGAPFWVRNQNGELNLQIVEQSQVNLLDETQRLIFNNSTHFNPVDIVAGLRDYKGKNFDLMKFRDENSYMIVNKTIGNVKIKSLELPGLWNGGMSDWISIFVEVPSETFNPVKEVTDLLRQGHIEKINEGFI